MRWCLSTIACAACTAEPADLRTAPKGTATWSTPTTDPTTDPTDTTPTPTPTGTGTTSTTSTTSTPTDGSTPEGIDVSRWQGTVDWDRVAADGISFAMVKATEGTYYLSPTHSEQYDGAYDVGLIRGAYHFAIPDDSAGADQAEYFVDNGGGWSADGQTLPGVLDIEWNPYGPDACYGLSSTGMADWIADFSDRYEALTGRYPMIYTAASWWSQCVGSDEFAATNPLWVAHYGAVTPNLPTGWPAYDFWQYGSTGVVDGVSGDCDVNVWNGTWHTLRDFASTP